MKKIKFKIIAYINEYDHNTRSLSQVQTLIDVSQPYYIGAEDQITKKSYNGEYIVEEE